jgi:hypothetical protein
MQRIISQAQQYGLPMHEAAELPPESEVADALRYGPRIHAGQLRGYDEDDQY